jgi:hypothetical protein
VVKERLGHGSIRTTELYLRSLPGSRDTGLDALKATWGARSSARALRPTREPTSVTTADVAVMLEDIKHMLEGMAMQDGARRRVVRHARQLQLDARIDVLSPMPSGGGAAAEGCLLGWGAFLAVD